MRECIILSGGLGTRLAHIIPNVPKSLAPIGNIPFLDYLIRYLIDQKVEHFIFSLGYLSEQIIQFIQEYYPRLHSTFIIEEDALGTGGAILNVIDHVESNDFFLCNADTFYPVNLNQLEKFHSEKKSNISIGIKPLLNPNRYGTVELDVHGKIVQFHEKRNLEYGLINGGIYLIQKTYLKKDQFPRIFSFEKEILEMKVNTDHFYGQVQDVFFLDIGVPEDYEFAQTALPNLSSAKYKRSLFLDRDGVINELIPNDYVKNWEEFKFKECFLENIREISSPFDYVFIITNQQVIGKGIISIDELNTIHKRMLEEIQINGGFITKIYYCPHLISVNCSCRKPKAGMIDQIRKEFPEVLFSESILIGDSESDIILAKSRGIKSVLLNSDPTISFSLDIKIESWSEFKLISVV